MKKILIREYIRNLERTSRPINNEGLFAHAVWKISLPTIEKQTHTMEIQILVQIRRVTTDPMLREGLL